MNPFNLQTQEEPQRPATSFGFLDQSARKALCKACGVEFKEHDHSQDVGKTVVRPDIRKGMVVCGPCGNTPIKFTRYCEARGDRSYGPSGGGWEVIVCECPNHGNAILRATWKDLVAHPDDLIVAFIEQMTLPEPPKEVEQGHASPLAIEGPVIDV